jgi:cytochrome c-type biogenesis protein CcmH/NrfG
MRLEKIVGIIIIALIITGILYMGFYFYVDMKQTASKNALVSTNLHKAYAQMVENETNANELTQEGYRLVQGNQLENGILNLQRATQVDPKNRDAWVWLGYAELKNNEPQKALKSLQEAEKIDPINAETFRLLTIAYQAVGDSESAKKSQEKYDFLKK